MRISKECLDRFWSKVDIGTTDECWEWQASRMGGRYGQIHIDGKNRIAHRVAYEISTGHSPEGHVIRHTCDNTRCCNPGHLLLGTQQQNMHDAVLRGRKYAIALDVEAVRDCRRRRLSGESIRSIAASYGITPSAASDAIRGVSWAFVDDPAPIPNPRKYTPLTEDQVARARTWVRSGASIRSAAELLEVNSSALVRAVRGTTWKEMSDPPPVPRKEKQPR